MPTTRRLGKRRKKLPRPLVCRTTLTRHSEGESSKNAAQTGGARLLLPVYGSPVVAFLCCKGVHPLWARLQNRESGAFS